MRLVRAVLPAMRCSSSRLLDAILTVTSTSIKEPIEGLLLSNVFRSGVANLVKSISRELSSDGIRINNLFRAESNTEESSVQLMPQMQACTRRFRCTEQRQAEQRRIPLGRSQKPSEFGAAAAFLLSDAARYITGATVVVDGGKTRSLWER